MPRKLTIKRNRHVQKIGIMEADVIQIGITEADVPRIGIMEANGIMETITRETHIADVTQIGITEADVQKLPKLPTLPKRDMTSLR